MTPHDAQKFGTPVTGWAPPPAPENVQLGTNFDRQLNGKFVRLERLDAVRHSADLSASFAADTDNRIWDYLPYGPFASTPELATWITATCTAPDPYFLAIIDLASDRAIGVASYLRINPDSGSIEVGHINFSPALQATAGATEAMYLMMKWAFQAGYRRYEWKCNALNLKSRRAAQRLGLSYEGVFRQATISKGRNRDTAWFAAIDSEWPALKVAFETWLDPANFDAEGKQRRALSSLTSDILVMCDPALVS